MTIQHTYVLDTSVLLADPLALTKFDEHDVVLPVVVIDELENKRHDPIRGYHARQALRALEQFRIESPTKDLRDPVQVTPEGGTLRVELNHQGQTHVHDALKGNSNDHRILSVATQLHAEHGNVVLVTKDLPLRLRASLAGLATDEYRNEQVIDTDNWTGVVRLNDLPYSLCDDLYEPGASLPLEAVSATTSLPTNTFIIPTKESGLSGLFRVNADQHITAVLTQRSRAKGRSAEQRAAIDLLNDPDVPIVSLGGPAGTGKTFLASAAALDMFETADSAINRIVFIRSIHAVGQQDLGYLPGNIDEKFEPWTLAIHDALNELVGRVNTRKMIADGAIEMMPVTYLRGRTINNAFVIVDEAQNLEYGVIRTALSRIGQNSKVVLTHDVSQRDSLHVGRHDGVAAVIAKMKGQQLFGHVELRKTERSEVARLVNDLLDEGA